MSRMLMVVPKPLPMEEVETLWQAYEKEFEQIMPEIKPTAIMKQCMRDAFYHGCVAVLMRNAPQRKENIQ